MADPSHSPEEDQPLLGGPGDAVQKDDQNLWYNLLQGTAVIAQGGIIILTVLIWVQVLTTKPYSLFHPHPLLNSAGILFLLQAILILQPTALPSHKIRGTYLHSAFNSLASAALIAGAIVIIYNKFSHNGTHFESPHAIVGLITYILLIVQALVGATAFYLPGLYGGVSNAKALYKYHRMSGYLLLVAMLVTVALATQTTFNVNSIHINLWAVIVLSVVVLVGTLPRVRKSKMGL